MKILITGANGFMGKNLQLHLAERKDVEVVCYTIKVLQSVYLAERIGTAVRELASRIHGLDGSVLSACRAD